MSQLSLNCRDGHTYTLENRNGIFYGWINLFAMWLIYFLTAAATAYGTTVLSTRMVLENGMSEEIVGWGTSAYYAAGMIFSVPASVMVQKRGFRFTLVLGSAMIFGACICNYFFAVPVLVYVMLFAAMGVGGTLSGTVTGPGLVNAWFDKNKSMPMFILMTAGAIGGFVIPMLSECLSNWIGWKTCWMIYGLFAAIGIAAGVLFIKNKPEDIGEVKDGHAWCRNHGMNGRECQDAVEESGITLQDALKGREFYTISAVLFGVRLLFTGCTSYLILYAIQRGVTPLQAAAALSCFHIFGLLGRMAGGLRNKVSLPIQVLCAICYGGMFVGGIVLFRAQSIGAFFTAAAVIGFFYNCSYTLLALMIPEYFGNKNYSIFFGTLNTIGSAGSTAAPLFISALTACFGGGYQYSFLVVSIIAALSAVLMLVTPPKPEKYGIQ